METNRTRKIVITGVLGAISIFLGITRWGFIPWFSGASLTIMAIPVIIGAVLEGPWVGLGIGFIFGLSSLIQAAIAPNGPADSIFTNPLISILPRLLIGPAAWLVWTVLKRWQVAGLVLAGFVGSFVNTLLVLGMIGLLGVYPWAILGPILLANGLPEAGVSAAFVLLIVAAQRQVRVRNRQTASF